MGITNSNKLVNLDQHRLRRVSASVTLALDRRARILLPIPPTSLLVLDRSGQHDRRRRWPA